MAGLSRRRLGRRIAELLTAKGLTQAELAKRTGEDPGDISRLVNGAGPESIGTRRLSRLANALGVPLATLFAGESTTITAE
jgi:transcriptional regulator with XRE-family HTH domain